MAEKDKGLAPTEQLQLNLDVRRRALPRQAVPFLALFLAAFSLFMAVIMFGSGNLVGGAVFSLVLIPLAMHGADVYRRWRHGPSAQDLRDAEAARDRDPWEGIG